MNIEGFLKLSEGDSKVVNLVIRANVAVGIFPGGGLQWPYQITPYRSALPGLAGYGMDFGGTDLPSKLYFITNRDDTSIGAADSSFGPDCFSGSERYCHQADQGAGFHKFVMPLVSGYVYTGRRYNYPSDQAAFGRGNMDYIGHAAPGQGLILRCSCPKVAGGSNVRLWHRASWMGDDPAAPGVTNMDADQRDCLQLGHTDITNAGNACINCEARFDMDEGVQCYYANLGFSWIRGIVADPLHAPPGWGMPPGSHHEEGHDHGYGMLLGGTSPLSDKTFTLQSLWAHTTDRNPLYASLNHAHINNLHYNHGRPDDGRGGACHAFDNVGHIEAAGLNTKSNVVGNMTVLGPNQQSLQAQKPVLYNGKPAPGSTAHLNHNTQFGWVPCTQQSDFYYENEPGHLQPNILPSAWPEGFGTNYSGVLRPFNNLYAPTVAESLAYCDLFRRTVGCKPTKRNLYSGGTNRLFDQIDNRIRGIPDSNQYINATSELGGWPVMPNLTVDPRNPGSEYWAPMPLTAARDDIVPNGGFFIDGSSSDGYSYLRRWIINQYHWSMGLTIPA